jgi:hypothetical protein
MPGKKPLCPSLKVGRRVCRRDLKWTLNSGESQVLFIFTKFLTLPEVRVKIGIHWSLSFGMGGHHPIPRTCGLTFQSKSKHIIYILFFFVIHIQHCVILLTHTALLNTFDTFPFILLFVGRNLCLRKLFLSGM